MATTREPKLSKRAKTLRAHGLQHRADIAGRGPDVAAHEGGGGLVGVFKRRVHGEVLARKSNSVS